MKNIKKNIEIGRLLLCSKLFRKHIPIFVSWSLTNRCNMHCKYCEIPSVKEKELDTKQIFKAIDGLSKSGTKVISFTGGEPLLREDIGRIVNYAQSKGIFVKVNSNGLLVKEKIDKIKNADVLQLSFDGPKDVHDLQRGRGSYDKVMKSVKIAKEKGIKVYFNTTITKFNLKHIINITKLAKKLKVSTSFQPVTDILFCTKGISSLYPNKEEFKLVLQKIMKEKRTNPYILNSYKSFEYMLSWPISGKINCFAGKVVYRIASNGRILPCNKTMDKSLKYNVLDSDLKKVFSEKLDTVCAGCWCITALELNHAFSLKLEPILNIIRLDFLK